MVFILFISFIILLRLAELVYSKNNEQWLLKNGAVEYGKNHYPFIVALHVLFIASLIVEYLILGAHYFSWFFFLAYLKLIFFKVWVVSSLGKFWNTKIYHIPGMPLIKRGPYKYVKHPNYIVVILEIAFISMVFHLYYTAVIFSVLNGIMLIIRVREENKALKI